MLSETGRSTHCGQQHSSAGILELAAWAHQPLLPEYACHVTGSLKLPLPWHLGYDELNCQL